MKSIFYLSLYLALTVASYATAASNLLDDPGFEASTGGSQTSNSNWILTANFPDLDNPTNGAAQFQFAPWASNPLGISGTGVWFKAFVGGGNNNWDPANATLSQTVAAGPGIYDLSFYVRHEENFMADAMWVSVSSDQGDLATFDVLNDTPNDGDFNQFSLSAFVASEGTTSLTVDAVMINGVAALANPQSLMLDDFSLTLVPEPSSLLLAGLSLVGMLGLYRRP